MTVGAGSAGKARPLITNEIKTTTPTTTTKETEKRKKQPTQAVYRQREASFSCFAFGV
jgi:hypothetical protein